nr:nuclear transport factor 2 family protein [Formosa sp. L2A11]
MHLKQLVVAIVLCLVSVSHIQAQNEDAIKSINTNLDAWHKAAAEANFNAYFNLMTKATVFVGTDASEHWERDAFKAYCKPHFDAGKAWSFSTLERHVYMVSDSIASFDELLDTHMGVSRGSGVMKFEDGSWKVAHYVLSAAIPNSKMSAVKTLKAEDDTTIISSFAQ